MPVVTGNLEQQYADLILAGYKTVEIRINDGKWSDVQVGDELHFNDGTVRVRVLEVLEYDSFREALMSHLEEALLGVTSVEEGLEIYRNIAGYRQKEASYGVIAFRIQLI